MVWSLTVWHATPKLIINIFLEIKGPSHEPMNQYYRVSKNVLYPKMQNFKNFYYNKDNRIWYFDLFKW